jgi:hypothetical protein
MRYEGLGLVMEKFQKLLLFSIPVFAIIYKLTFLFFLPIVFFVIIGLGNVKKRIVEGASDDVITNSILSIWKWTLFLWVLEMAFYALMKYAFQGAF